MPRATLRELRELGLSWPPGPVDPPANEDESFDLLGEATGCESLYHDTKGDSRYLDQKAEFEALAAKLAKASKRTKSDDVPKIAAPMTRRKLESVGLRWPAPAPTDPDEPIDIDSWGWGLYWEISDNRSDQTANRALLDEITALTSQLDAMKIPWKKDAQPAPRVVQEKPPARPFNLPITRRKLQAIGCEWPFPYPEGLDEAIDVAAGIDRLVSIDVHEYTGGRQSYLQEQLARARGIEEKLDELGIALRSTTPAISRPQPNERVPSSPPGEDVSFARTAPVGGEDLLRVILEHPDDEGPRLAYAAAIGDADPRAQFIRLQCEASSLPSWSPARRVLEARFIRLLVRNRDAWEGGIRGLVKRATFRRGFVENVEVEGGAFAANADRIFALHPVREVECATGFEALARSPALRRLRRLDLSGDASAVMTSPHLDSLRELWLSKGRIGEAFASAMSSGAFRSLEQLRIWEIDDLERIASALPSAVAIPALNDLTLHGPPLDDRSLHALADSDLAARLRSLHIRVARASAASAFANGDYRSLEKLNVDGSTLTAPAALARLRAPNVERLALFSISSLRSEDAGALAGLRFDRLRDLTIAGGRFEDAGFAALAAAPWFAGLERLYLRGDTLFTSTAASLLARLGTKLRALEIEAVDSSGLANAIARSPAAAHLEALRVESAIPERELEGTLACLPNLRGFSLAHQWKEPNPSQDRVLRAAGFEPCGGEKGCYVRTGVASVLPK